MENDQKEGVSKYPILKIIIPVLIVLIIAGIWILKNSQKEKDTLPVEGNSDFALNVTEEIDMEQLKSYGVPIIIDFGADKCIPCKQMAPVLKELNEELQGKAIIKFVDVWKYQSLAEGYPISLIPTQIIFDSEGNPYTPKNADAIPLTMYSAKDTNEHIFTTHEGGITKEELLSMLNEMGMEE